MTTRCAAPRAAALSWTSFFPSITMKAFFSQTPLVRVFAHGKTFTVECQWLGGEIREPELVLQLLAASAIPAPLAYHAWLPDGSEARLGLTCPEAHALITTAQGEHLARAATAAA